MAVYVFECASCGHRFEMTMPITQHDRVKMEPPRCPVCSSRDTHQIPALFHCRISAGS